MPYLIGAEAAEIVFTDVSVVELALHAAEVGGAERSPKFRC
jgi:hypothetical protein